MQCFRAMVILFSSPECTYDEEYIKAYTDISLLKTEIAPLLEKSDEEESQDKGNPSFEPNERIRENSPFYQHFLELQTHTITHLNSKVTDQRNRFYIQPYLFACSTSTYPITLYGQE